MNTTADRADSFLRARSRQQQTLDELLEEVTTLRRRNAALANEVKRLRRYRPVDWRGAIALLWWRVRGGIA